MRKKRGYRRKDGERLRQGRVEGGLTDEGKGGRRDRIGFTSKFWHTIHTDGVPQGAGPTAPEKRRVHIASPGECRDAPHTDRAPLGGPLTVPESKVAWHPSAHFATPFTRNAAH